MKTIYSYLLSLIAGAATPFAIAPYPHWYLGIISVAIFAWVLNQPLTKKQLWLRSFLFGLGYFGIGVSWVFVSIYQFGNASLPLAVILTGLFVIFVAAIFALPFYLLHYFSPSSWRLILGFPMVWAFSEWIRTWLFTGFPWLFLGYGHIDNPLAGWAPIGGVIFVSLLSAFISAVIANLFNQSANQQIKLLPIIAVVIIWAEGKSLAEVEWTDKNGDAISVGIVQPNIPQELKWSPNFREPTLDILTGLSDNLWQQDWLLWPEAAIPDLYHRSEDFITAMNKKAIENNSSLITGILYDKQDEYIFYNSLIGLGEAKGMYFKQRLVPFGEYVPLEVWLRGLIAFFDLPTSIIRAGNSDQSSIIAGDIPIAGAICYEIVYPELIATLAKNAEVIITVSNDAWFGQSVGPRQHFHMARMRAIETGRYVIRGTNNGISAVIKPDGSIQEKTDQFVRTYLNGEIIPMKGNTPYIIWKNYFLLVILLLMTTILVITNKKINVEQQFDHSP